jgi:hypothetical protein
MQQIVQIVNIHGQSVAQHAMLRNMIDREWAPLMDHKGGKFRGWETDGTDSGGEMVLVVFGALGFAKRAALEQKRNIAFVGRPTVLLVVCYVEP